jgi:hypothetical protein
MSLYPQTGTGRHALFLQPIQEKTMSQMPNYQVAERQTIHVTVHWIDHNDPPLTAYGPDRRQLLLNDRVVGDLWTTVKQGDILEVDILPEPGKWIKILAVRLPSSQRQNINVTVCGVSPDIDYVRADGPDGRQYALNTKVMGDLWGKVAQGDILELDTIQELGQATKILAVRRPQQAAK